jgi:hypothetical protein
LGWMIGSPVRTPRGAIMNIRVQRIDRTIITIDVNGESRVDPTEFHYLDGHGVQHFFTPEGYYDRSEPRPVAPPSTEAHRLDVGPAEGTACVP